MTRQLVKALSGTGAPQRILPVAARVLPPVNRVQRRVLDDDVRRVCPPPAWYCRPRMRCTSARSSLGIRVRQTGARVVLSALEQYPRWRSCRSLPCSRLSPMATFSLKSALQTVHALTLSAATSSRKREIATANGSGPRPRRRPAPLGDVARVARRFVSAHSSTNRWNAPTGSALNRRWDRSSFAEAELADGRRQRAVEDELLDELRRLQQRVALAGGLEGPGTGRRGSGVPGQGR